jgi:hypothetical protein
VLVSQVDLGPMIRAVGPFSEGCRRRAPGQLGKVVFPAQVSQEEMLSVAIESLGQKTREFLIGKVPLPP